MPQEFVDTHVDYIPQDYPNISTPDEAYIQMTLESFLRKNLGMLTVFGVDALEDMGLFAMGEAYLSQGRTFTKEESAGGSRVCLVSEVFAAENRLAIGQSLPLEIYENEFLATNQDDSTNYYYMEPFYTPREPVMTETYTIIGFYKAPLWQMGTYCFSPNTVIVPKNGLTGESLSRVPAVESWTLQNGGRQAFYAALAAKGVDEDAFAVFDYGYDEIAGSLAGMREDTRLVLYVCSALFFAAVCVALMLTALRMEKEADTLRRLGATQRDVFGYLFFCMAFCALAAGALGYVVIRCVSGPVFSWVSELYAFERLPFSTLNGVLPALNPNSNAPLILGALLGCAVTCLMAGFICVRITLKGARPMRGGRTE